MRRARRAALLIAACLAGCSAAEPEPEYRNVLLIVVDTLRRDHLGAYGYERATSPQLDRFAASAVRYERAWSQAPWTTPSLAALLTSRQPARLGITSLESTLPESATLLSERLAAAGWTTGAIVSHRFVSKRWGFARGFDHFDDDNALDHDAITSPAVSQRALEFLNAHRGIPFFLWLHYFDPHFAYREHPEHAFERHAPYDGPAQPGVRFGALLRMQQRLGPADARELIRRYDSEIAFTDAHIGRVLDHLTTLGLDANTLVVFTADHGEEFLEHARLGHTKTLYEEVVAVPLLVRFPGGAAGVVAAPVALVDVAPTILDVLGLPADPQAAGRVLPRPGESASPERVVLTATERPRRKIAAMSEGFKLIRDGSHDEYYDLAADPGERHPLTDRSQGPFARLERAIEQLASGSRDGHTIDLSQEERERLRALGYGLEDD
jgi:arylsulfatase A-like enzyme